jgi:hypothetical protein
MAKSFNSNEPRMVEQATRDRHVSMLVMRTAIALLSCLAISGCGMAKVARETGQTFDKYGCLARDFKGQPPCEPDNAAAP